MQLTEPSLSDQRTDSQRIFDELDDLELTVDLDVYRTLGKTLRESDYQVTAVVADNRLIAVEPGDTTTRSFGLAFDLGTTTVVANLMDITTGTPVAVTSMLNKQQPYGADVIARISATMLDSQALGHLQQLARETLGHARQGGVRRGRRGRQRDLRGSACRQCHDGAPASWHRP